MDEQREGQVETIDEAQSGDSSSRFAPLDGVEICEINALDPEALRQMFADRDELVACCEGVQKALQRLDAQEPFEQVPAGPSLREQHFLSSDELDGFFGKSLPDGDVFAITEAPAELPARAASFSDVDFSSRQDESVAISPPSEASTVRDGAGKADEPAVSGSAALEAAYAEPAPASVPIPEPIVATGDADAGFASAFRELIPFPQNVNRRSLSDFMIACSELPGISDVSIRSGDFVWVKLHGQYQRLTRRKLEPDEVELVAVLTCGKSAVGRLNTGVEISDRAEFLRTIDDAVGFRANFKRCRVGDTGDAVAATFRAIPERPRELETLGLEEDVTDNLFYQYGLMLIVGTTGSGKSTILDSVLAHRLKNSKSPKKIGVYAEPIEGTFGSLGLGDMPLVEQIQIGEGSHLTTWSQVGPNAMRNGYDVLVVGEMRDKESVAAGLELAETGHAVYATLHTETPAQAVGRIISFFPEDEQPSVASKLRAVLRIVLAQKQMRNSIGLSERIRSWCCFDREAKSTLAELRHHEWEKAVSKICADRSTDFDSRVLDVLRAGRLTFADLRDITGFTRREAIAYCEARGIDVSNLG